MYRRVVSAVPRADFDIEQREVEVTAKDLALGFVTNAEEVINVDVINNGSNSEWEARIVICSKPESVCKVNKDITLRLNVSYENRPHHWKDLIIEWNGEYEEIDHSINDDNTTGGNNYA